MKTLRIFTISVQSLSLCLTHTHKRTFSPVLDFFTHFPYHLFVVKEDAGAHTCKHTCMHAQLTNTHARTDTHARTHEQTHTHEHPCTISLSLCFSLWKAMSTLMSFSIASLTKICTVSLSLYLSVCLHILCLPSSLSVCLPTSYLPIRWSRYLAISMHLSGYTTIYYIYLYNIQM